MAGKLIDPATQKPLKAATLTEPQAVAEDLGQGAMASGTEPRKQLPEPLGAFTPRKVAAMLKDADEGRPEALLGAAEQLEDVFWYYRLELAKRRRVISGAQLVVEAAGDDAASIAAADLVRELVAGGGLRQARFDALDAISKGFSVIEIEWRQTAERWWPVKFRWRSPRWFRWGSDDVLRLSGKSGLTDLAPAKFIVTQLGDRSGMPIQGGLCRPALLIWLFTSYTLKDWAEFLEAYGRPLVTGQYAPGSTPEQQDSLAQAVAAIASGGRAIYPTGMRLDVAWSNGRSTDAYERRADWLHKQISLLVLGQNLTSDVTGGSLAAARVHDGVRMDIAEDDAQGLDAAFNAQLVRSLVDFNLGPPADGRYPQLVTRFPEAEDLAALANALGPMIDRGLRIEESQLRDRFGFADPEEGAALMQPQKSGAAGATSDGPTTAPQSSVLPVGQLAIHARQAEEQALIDELVAEALTGNVANDTMAPILAPIREALDQADSFEAFEANLPALMAQMDVSAFAEDFARRAFLARLASRAPRE